MKINRKLSIVSLLLLAITFMFTAVACGSDEITGDDDTGSYAWTYIQEFADEYDADMKIDGVLDEARWQNHHYLKHSEENVELEYTTIFTQKGLYIGAKAHDEKMKWTARFNFSHFTGNKALNSAFWFQICGPDVVDGHAFRLFNFFVDAFNSASRNQTRFIAKSKVNGDITKGQATEMTSEFFVSWDALNIELGENGELPEFVYLVPSYRFVLESDTACTDNRWLIPTCTYPRNTMWWNYEGGYAATVSDFNWYRVKTGIKFNGEGYINYDREGAKVGRSDSGICMSDGWDMSKAAEGEVSVVAPYEQYAFVKGVYAEKYYFKTTLLINDYLDGDPSKVHEWPSIGVATVQSNVNLRAFYIEGGVEGDGANRRVIYNFANGAYYTPCTSIEFQNWTKNAFGRVYSEKGKDTPTEGFTIEVIKDGTMIYYIVEGQFVGYDNVLELAGKACPALFSIGGRGTFKDIEYNLNGEFIDAMIKECCKMVSVSVTGSGSVIPDNDALKIMNGAVAQDLTVQVLPDVNYVVSNVTLTGVNVGEYAWDYFMARYTEGTFVIPKEDITGDVAINVTFSRFTAKTYNVDTVKLNGTITTVEGDTMTGSKILIYSKTCPSLYYVITTSSMGTYQLYVPKAGEYEIGGNTLVCDGKYEIQIASMNGYKMLLQTIDVSEVTESSLTRDFTLDRFEFVPSEIMTDKYSSPGYEFTEDNACAVRSAYYFADESVEQGEDFVLYTTVSKTEASEFGFVVGTGNSINGRYLYFAMKKSDNGYTAYVWTEGGREVGYGSSSFTFFKDKLWMSLCPFGEKGDELLDMALVYKNGKYAFYLNDCEAYTISEDEKVTEFYGQNPKPSFKEIIGTEGDKRLGLVSLNKKTSFYEWGFSTEAEDIAKVGVNPRPIDVPPIDVESTLNADKPALKELAELSSDPLSKVYNNTLSLKGAYYFDTNGLDPTADTEFVLSATIMPDVTAPEIGFVIGTGNGMTDGNYLFFVWRTEQKDMYLWNRGLTASSGGMKSAWGEYKFGAALGWMKDKPFGENGDTPLKMALVYKDGAYSLYFNGQFAYTWAETFAVSGSTTIKDYVEGDYGMLRLGLISTNEITTFSDWGYTTDESEVNKYYAGETSKPALGDWLYGGGSQSITDGKLNLKGAYLYNGAKVKNDADYVLYATFTRSEATELGFAITTNNNWNGSVKNLMFVYRGGSSDMFLWGNSINSSISSVTAPAVGQKMTMQIVHKNAKFYVFINGAKVVEISDASIKNALGTGDIYLGIVSINKVTTYTDWGYSIDADEINAFFAE